MKALLFPASESGAEMRAKWLNSSVRRDSRRTSLMF